MKLKETLLNHEISLGIRRTIRFFFSVLILFSLVVPTWASEVSLRVKGMGRELAGIVSDSETDILMNPARLMELEKREVLAVFEPRSSSKLREIRNPTLSFKGFFPSFVSSKIGFGFWGEGAKQQLSDGLVRKEKYGSSWSGDLYILENEFSGTNTRGSERFLGKPFFSWSPSPRIRFGISYEYDIESTENQRESETRRIEFDPFTIDTVRVDQSILDVKDDIAQTSHIVRLGTAFDLSDRTFLELLGQLTISQDDSTNDYTSERLAFWESSWVRTWSDSNGNYIDSTYNSRNSVYKNVKNRNPLLDSQQFSVGFKISREISDATTMRFIGSVSRGTGDLSGRNDEISEVKYEEYSFRYIESETETTTVIYGD
ncbi:hypothetical protein IIA15_05460, partial [candidate division TA06 bacterium]|nr:hypothetical protein [candidate division TA06 bacterium]